MASHDINSNVSNKTLFETQVLTGTTVATIFVDLLGFEGCEFLISSFNGGSAVSPVNPITVNIQESDDTVPANFTDVADEFIIGTKASATLDATGLDKKLGYVGHKRYARLELSATGADTDIQATITSVLGRPHVAPIAQG